MYPVMLLPTLPRVMGVLQESVNRPGFLRRRDRLPVARMFGILCLMFLQDVVQKTVREGYRLSDYISSSFLGEQEAVHHHPHGEARAYASGKISSTRPSNDGVPGSRISRQGILGNKRLTFVATSFQNVTISKRSWALDCGQMSRDSAEEMGTNFLNSKNLTRNVTSSSVNATPFPVVLRKSARGGVGDRVLPFSLSSRARRRAAAIVSGPGTFGGFD